MRRILIAFAAGAFLAGGTATAASRWLITSTHQIKPSVLTQLHGTQGKTGPRGRPGPPGRFTPSNVKVVQGALVTLCVAGLPQTCNVGTGIAECPPGSIAIAGGWDQPSSFSQNSTVSEDRPSDNDTAWFVAMENHDTINAEAFIPYVVCAR